MFNIKKLYLLSLFTLISFILTILFVNIFSLKLEKIKSTIKEPSVRVEKIIKTVVVTSTPDPLFNSDSIVKPKNVNTQTSVTNTQQCIITVDGIKYDVTQFKNAHSGGNIFKCGQDMSSDFWGQHGKKQLNAIQKYKV